MKDNNKHHIDNTHNDNKNAMSENKMKEERKVKSTEDFNECMPSQVEWCNYCEKWHKKQNNGNDNKQQQLSNDNDNDTMKRKHKYKDKSKQNTNSRTKTTDFPPEYPRYVFEEKYDSSVEILENKEFLKNKSKNTNKNKKNKNNKHEIGDKKSKKQKQNKDKQTQTSDRAMSLDSYDRELVDGSYHPSCNLSQQSKNKMKQKSNENKQKNNDIDSNNQPINSWHILKLQKYKLLYHNYFFFQQNSKEVLLKC